MSKKLGVGLHYTSGKLIDIIINLPQGVQMLTLTKDVDGVPFSADENYIIVFKGTKYTNGAFARIMAFQGNQFDTFKLGMVTWDASSVSWNDVATKSDLNDVSNKLMLDGMKTLSVKWTNSDTLEFYVDNTRVFGILAKWSENYS